MGQLEQAPMIWWPGIANACRAAPGRPLQPPSSCPKNWLGLGNLMHALRITILTLLCLLMGSSGWAQGSPVKDGSVWAISYIHVKPGMMDAYMRDLAATRKPLMEAAKKAGLILSERMLVGQAQSRDDYNLMLMVEYKNWAAFDGLSDKFDALSQQIIGTEEKRQQLMVKRSDMRELYGNREFQEVWFK